MANHDLGPLLRTPRGDATRLPGRWSRRPLLSGLALCSLAVFGQPASAQSDDFLRQALDLVNGAREEADLGPLESGEDLVEAAAAHAEDMLARDFYAHESPEGDTVQDRYREAGGSEWELVAENIARCTGCPAPDAARIASLQEGWMNSPGHRANILREGLARFGFAIVGGGGRDLYAVQTFAGPGLPRGDDTQSLAAADAAAVALERLNAARGEADLTPLQPSPVLSEAAGRLVPEDLSGFSLSGMEGLGEALPPEDRGSWLTIASLAGSCGGCGAALTRGDAQAFVAGWLEPGRSRQRLLDPALTHFGFVLRSDGAGRKVALGLFAETATP